MNVRTRFAPSPTGSLHIGNIRTALYAWLFARNQGGTFVLRIEDTNLDSRISVDSVKNIITMLKWLNLDWDEGPYFQSRRLTRYRSIINDMLKYQLAYKCYCSKERLEMLRLNQIKNKEKPKYDRYCRGRSVILKDNNRVDNFSSYVIRFCNPIVGKISFCDQIRGMITFNNQELDDVIICRSNGIPTYNFCVVVDDIDMKITHVIRGEEHINNTPRQINIIKALKASIPIYAHVPMVLDSNRKKLSKRYEMSGIMKYRVDGFLPEAVLNYLIRLGWSYGNQEIFSIDQMKKFFCFTNINKSSSVFNFDKLLWLNRYYIRNLPLNYVIRCLSEYMNTHSIKYKNTSQLIDIVRLFSKRCNTLKEMVNNYTDLYKDFEVFEKQIVQKYLTPVMMDSLKLLRSKLKDVNCWALDVIHDVMIQTTAECYINIRTMSMTVRVALIGTEVSPNINAIIHVLGKNYVLHRIDQVISYIQGIT